MSSLIDHDSELFTNYVSAVGIPKGRQFFAVTDDHGKPAIFSLSSDNRLYLYHFKEGVLINKNFGEACGHKGAIESFHVAQTSNGNIFVCFSISTAPSESQIFALPSLPLSELVSPKVNNIVKSAKNLRKIYSLWISKYQSLKGLYPDVIVSYQAEGHISKSQDCELLLLSGSGSNASLLISKDWSLPVNTDRIIDLAFARSVAGDGVVVLYEVNGQKSLIYTTYDGSEFTVSPYCPKDATCISCVQPEISSDNSDTDALLWLGGDKPYLYTSKEYLHKEKQPKQISSTFLNSSIKDIHAIQNKNHFTVWFTNEKDAAFYYTSSTLKDPTTGDLVPLLPAGKGGSLSGQLSTTKVGKENEMVNTIISVNDKNQLTSLQQSREGGSWDAYPLMTIDTQNNYHVQSYTTRVRVRSGVNNVAANSTFLLKTSGRISAIINGSDCILDPAGQLVLTDDSGHATFIVATADLGSQTFSISDVTGADGVAIKALPVTINPAAKVNKKLATIKTHDDLIKAGFKVDKETGDKAAPIIGQLADHAIDLHKKVDANGSAGGGGGGGGGSGGVTVMSVAAGDVIHVAEPNKVEQFWTWVCHIADEIHTYYIDTIDGIRKFVVHWAEEKFEFLLDTIDRIGKALTWVWTKIKVVFNDVIAFVGMLFNWQDILDAKNSIHKLIDSSFDWGFDKIDYAKSEGDAWIEKVRAHYKTETTSAPDDVNKGSRHKDADEKQSSVGLGFAGYHLSHGGEGGGLLSSLVGIDPGIFDGILPQLKEAVDKVWTDIENIGEDIVELFKNIGGDVPVSDMLAKIGKDSMVLLLDLLKGVFDILMTTIKNLFQVLKGIGDQAIELPIFTALYKDMTGDTLTIIDVMSLLIALPAQFMYKLMNGKALPKIDKFISKDKITGYINSTLPANEDEAINVISEYGYLGINIIIGALGTLDILIKNIDPGSVIVNAASVPVTVRGPRMLSDAGPGTIVTFADPVPAPPVPPAPPKPKFSIANFGKQKKVALHKARGFIVLNILSSCVNLILAFPRGNNWINWTPWSISLLRTTIQAIQVPVKILDDNIKKTLRRITFGFAIIQVGFSIAATTRGKNEAGVKMMRILISSCSFAATASRFVADEAPKDSQAEAAAGLLFVVISNIGTVLIIGDMGFHPLPWYPAEP